MMDYKLLKSILKGVLTFVPGVGSYLSKKKEKSKHSGSNALFVYSLWMSTLVYLKENNILAELSKIGEIGNGGSLGIAFCALLTGTQKYYSLALKENIDFEQQLNLLDEIESLFNKEEPIQHFDRINIKIDNYEFPKEIVFPLQERSNIVQKLKKELLNGLIDSKLISIVHNWESKPSLGITFTFSRAVMEHVNKPSEVYYAIERHLLPGSYMLHDIEFHSHGITKNLNGHLKIPSLLWFIIYGERPFFLNRWVIEDHIAALESCRFEITKSDKVFTKDIVNNYSLPIGGVIIARKLYNTL